MKKGYVLVAVIPLLVLGSCIQDKSGKPDSVSGASAQMESPVRLLLERFMPDSMADGIVKIAILVNQEMRDNSRLFIEGCVFEGRSMGFTVDWFITDGDENRCMELAAGIARADYDGLIFSDGAIDFSYDILKPIADRGVRIVTFETLPYRDGKYIKGLVTTFQNDYRLARLSLDTLLSYCSGNEEHPSKVIRIGCDPGITFLDRRAWEFDQLVGMGRIKEAAMVKLAGLENPQRTAWEAFAAVLPHFPYGSVDAVWVPWSEFAAGCAEALASAGRQDIKLISIGISNDDMRLMMRHSQIWLANTAVDPHLTGVVNMRILAARLAGESLQDTFSFEPRIIKTADLNYTTNMSNIGALVPDWGDGKGLFDQYQWMSELKAAGTKYIRVASPPSGIASIPPAALISKAAR